jgi:hypothetical protein
MEAFIKSFFVIVAGLWVMIYLDDIPDIFQIIPAMILTIWLLLNMAFIILDLYSCKLF